MIGSKKARQQWDLTLPPLVVGNIDHCADQRDSVTAKGQLMDRAVTAIYRSYAMASLVREELERLGLGRDRITVLPAASIVSNAEEASGSATTRGNVENALARLHELLLSEGDTQACQQALQNRGYMVLVDSVRTPI